MRLQFDSPYGLLSSVLFFGDLKAVYVHRRCAGCKEPLGGQSFRRATHIHPRDNTSDVCVSVTACSAMDDCTSAPQLLRPTISVVVVEHLAPLGLLANGH